MTRLVVELAAAALCLALLASGAWWKGDQHGRRAVQAEWDAQRLRNAEAAALATAAAQRETADRIAQQQENHRVGELRAQRAAADAAAAARAHDGLQHAFAQLAGTCSRGAAADPPVVAGVAPAASAGDLLADVQRRIDEAAGDLAAEADRRGTAGSSCERDYDALMPAGRGLRPPAPPLTLLDRP